MRAMSSSAVPMRAKESFGVTSVAESKRIYENYLKNQKATKKGK